LKKHFAVVAERFMEKLIDDLEVVLQLLWGHFAKSLYGEGRQVNPSTTERYRYREAERRRPTRSS
jgi:hypothetical protein